MNDARQPPPDVRFEFDHEPGAPRQARRALDPLFNSDPEDPIAEAVRLTASELVSNVVQHTEDGGSMHAWDPKPNVPFRLEVRDHDHLLHTRTDVPESDPLDDAGGRGLVIIDQVADDWGVDRTDEGKTVWAEFNRPPDTDS